MMVVVGEGFDRSERVKHVYFFNLSLSSATLNYFLLLIVCVLFVYILVEKHTYVIFYRVLFFAIHMFSHFISIYYTRGGKLK
jgi:hypothetical protein